MAPDSTSGSSWYRQAARCRQLAHEASSQELPPTAVEELRGMVASGDALVREAAVRALGIVLRTTPESSSQESAVEALLEAVVIDSHQRPGLEAALKTLSEVASHIEASHARVAAAVRSVMPHGGEISTGALAAALSLLEQVVVSGDEEAATAASSQCHNVDPVVRVAAVGLLSASASPGDEEMLKILADSQGAKLGSCADPDWLVRVSALRALGKLGLRHSSQVRRVVVAAARDLRAEVRSAAAAALCNLSPQGDPSCVDVLCDLSNDRNDEVCCTALRSLGQVAKKSDGSRPYAAVKACLDCLETGQLSLQGLAVQTATTLAGRNDSEVVKAVARGLESRDEEVRTQVPEKLLVAADGDDELVVAQLVRRVSDEQPPVRRAAVAALRQVVPKGSDAAVQLLAGRAGSPAVEVRLAVMEALQHMAIRGDERATEAVIERLSDGEGRVRVAAIRCLAVVAEQDSDTAIIQVGLRLEDVDASVRAAVAEAFPSIASPDSQKAWQCLSQCCRSLRPPPHRENIREAACWALARFAARGSVQAISAICGTIDADYPQATVGALKALLQVALCGDPGAIDGAAAALIHKDERTRHISMEVLEQLADRGSAQPASSAAATAFEGSWSGGVIKGRKIFWNCDDLITPLELKGKSTISTICVDNAGREFHCWARLDAHGRLRWDFGDDWTRSEDVESTSLPALCGATLYPTEGGTSGYPTAVTLPPETDELQTSEAHDEDSEGTVAIGDTYAVAAVAAHFKSKDAFVREVAVAALPRVAGKGCRLAIEVLLPLMQDESVSVRFAAVESLLAVAPKGDRLAINTLVVRLEDQECKKDPKHGISQGMCVGIRAAEGLKHLVTTREDLVDIAKSLKFTGPSIRGF